MPDAPLAESPDSPPSSDVSSGLQLAKNQLSEMIAHCIACAPEEGCGLLVGDTSGRVHSVHPAHNTAASAQLYTVDPTEHLRIDRRAEALGLAVIGVFHSHTHTDPWPSPTDVLQAPDPAWHYVIIGLRHEAASTRSYRIEGGNISEEPVVVLDSYNLT